MRGVLNFQRLFIFSIPKANMIGWVELLTVGP